MATNVMVMMSHNAALVFDTMLALKGVVEMEAFNNFLYAAALIGFLGLIISKSLGTKGGNGLQAFVIAIMVLWVGVKSTLDLAIENPATGEVYIVQEAPAGLAITGWLTSAVGVGVRDLYAMQFTTANGGDVLAGKGGVGRGLAIILGTQGVSWSERSRDPRNDEANGKFTNLEASINNYLRDCYIPTILHYGSKSGMAAFHNPAPGRSVLQIWTRVRTNLNKTTDLIIDDSTEIGSAYICLDAWTTIAGLLNTQQYSAATEDDSVYHMARQIAATVMPGRSSNLEAGANGGVNSNATIVRMKAEAAAVMQALFGDISLQVSIVTLDRLNNMLLSAYGSLPQDQNLDNLGRFNTALNDAISQQQLSMAATGDWWTRNAAPFSAIMEILVYGFLPFMLLYMFISPKGLTAILGIVGVYLWMQTWPLAYIIINYATTLTFSSSMELFIKNDTSIGMEDVHAMWDQVRHSYAVSQSMLGLTPIITGALITGSMMMLTKLAGNMSGTENFDETRVARDTESAAPIIQTTPGTQQFLDGSGSVVQNKSMDGVGQDINAQENLSKQTAEKQALAKLKSETLGNTVLDSAQKNVSKIDNKTLEKMFGADETLGNSFKTNISSALDKIDSEGTSEVKNIAGKLGINGSVAKQINDAKDDEDAKAKIELRAGLEVGTANAFLKQFQESETYRESLETTLTSANSMTYNDRVGEAVSESTAFSHSEKEDWSRQAAEVKSSQQAYEQSAALQKTVGASKVIDEGQQWNIMNELINNMDRAALATDTTGMSLSEKDEAKHNAMTRAAMAMGMTPEQAGIMATAKEKGLAKSQARGNAGAMWEASGMLSILKDTGGRWEDFIVQNDPELRGNFNDVSVPVDKTGVDDDSLTLNKTGMPNLKRTASNAHGQLTFTDEENALLELLKRKVVDATDGGHDFNNQVSRELAAQLAKIEDGKGAALWGDAANAELSENNGLLFDGSTKAQQQKVRAENHLLSSYIKASNAALDVQKNGGDSGEALSAANSELSNILNRKDKAEYEEIKETQGEKASNEYMKEKLDSLGMASDLYGIQVIGENITNGILGRTDKITGEKYTQSSIDKPGFFENAGVSLKELLNIDLSSEDRDRQYLKEANFDTSSYGDYGSSVMADMQSVEAYNNVEAKLAALRKNGEATYSDMKIAEVSATLSHFSQDVDDQKITDFMSDLATKSVNGSGFGLGAGMFNKAGGLIGVDVRRGVTADNDMIDELYQQHFGTSYNDALDKLPSDLREVIEQKQFEALDKHVRHQEEFLTQGANFSQASVVPDK